MPLPMGVLESRTRLTWEAHETDIGPSLLQRLHQKFCLCRLPAPIYAFEQDESSPSPLILPDTGRSAVPHVKFRQGTQVPV